MKKFLIYLVVILVAVGVGFTVFYLVSSNEVISISAANIYMHEGEVIDDLELLLDDGRSYTDYESVTSSDKNIATYNEDGNLVAVGGGVATITFRTNNPLYRNLSCQIYVGDGSITNPFYIQTADEFKSIGGQAVLSNGSKIDFGLNKAYKLVNNINLNDGMDNTGYWVPIGVQNSASGFTGVLDGNGYTVSNLNINKQEYITAITNAEKESSVVNYNVYTDAGLFSKIGTNGRVTNLYIDNVIISGNYKNEAILGNVGIVAGVNSGTIERVQVTNAVIGVTGVANTGGIAGVNSSYDYIDSDSNYIRGTARIDRASAIVRLGVSSNADGAEVYDGISGNVGGLVGKNSGGIVIYSYSRGEAFLNQETVNYGGIVGYNLTHQYDDSKDEQDLYVNNYVGAHVKDTYTTMQLRKNITFNPVTAIGGIIGFNEDDTTSQNDSEVVNKVVGNYYLQDNLNGVSGDVGATITSFEGVGRYWQDGVDQTATYEDTEYVVTAADSGELKSQVTYLSHIKNEKVQEGDTVVDQSIVVTWKFGTVWSFNEVLNDGYPVINFANIELSDDIVTLATNSIKSVADLRNMKLDGHYTIEADIVFTSSDDVWKPIGTEKNPFIGSLTAKASDTLVDGNIYYYQIKNLATTKEENVDNLDLSVADFTYKYSGLFGVTSGEAGGSITNITMVNPYVHGNTAGAIVGSNGISGKKGTSIFNVKVDGGKVIAGFTAGGIAGNNFGSISYSYVVNKTEVQLVSDSGSYAGGIAGVNEDLISATLFENSSVTARTATDIKTGATIGGIAARNTGTIDSVSVYNETFGTVALQTAEGVAGGVVGVNLGTIRYVLVRTGVSGAVDNNLVYVGGVAGQLIGASDVNYVTVDNARVRGYYAGGIAGLFNYDTSNGDHIEITLKNNNFNDATIVTPNNDKVQNVTILSNTSIEGAYSAGFVSKFDNGLLENCYTAASIKGVNGESIKAGFAAELNHNGAQKTVGVISKSFSAATFDAANGKSYATVNSDELLKEYVIKDNTFDLNRTTGYMFDYAYITRENVEDPSLDFIIGWGNDLGNWITGKDDENIIETDKPGTGASEEDFLNNTTKILSHRDFSTTYWTYSNGSYPTLKAVDSVQSVINSIIKKEFTIKIYSDNISVTKNGEKVEHGDTIKTGDVLVFNYTETPQYEMASFLLNGKDIINGYKYAVQAQDVSVSYTETRDEFEVKLVANGGEIVTPSNFVKYGSTVDVTFRANENMIFDSYTIITASGETITLNALSQFVMPKENVTITVNYVQGYVVTFDNTELVVENNGVAINSEDYFVDGTTLNFDVIEKAGYTYVVDYIVGTNIVDITNLTAITLSGSDVTIDVRYIKIATLNLQNEITATVNGAAVASGVTVQENDIIIISKPTAGTVTLNGVAVEFDSANYFTYVVKNTDDVLEFKTI